MKYLHTKILTQITNTRTSCEFYIEDSMGPDCDIPGALPCAHYIKGHCQLGPRERDLVWEVESETVRGGDYVD
jgi:hypothetical protein